MEGDFTVTETLGREAEDFRAAANDSPGHPRRTVCAKERPFPYHADDEGFGAKQMIHVQSSILHNHLAMASCSDLPAVEKKLEGQVALITGGASGIGECTARLFCRHGAKVVIADVQDELGKALCGDLGAAASFIHCDVTSEDDVSAAVDHAVSKFGKLDIMFNNAGIGGAACHNILHSEKSDFERVLAVNLVGPYLGTKHAARVMIPARRGSIIATSSVAGVMGAMAAYPYTCSKHALVGLTKNAAAELGQFGIRVNCVSPAAAATPLSTGYVGLDGEAFEAAMAAAANLKGVNLRTDDIAKALLYLASDDAKYVSGHNLVIDGGCTVAYPSFNLFSREEP
ncbi:momilactone A synthase-like [Canna indica]|uniref:Momilactone A synthase-like n=1 Tax=Canna indica TaxID=4628 RepID=A0AAQ3K7Q5_9LILI|nr:momilactone A synthase-like [Canna indica]